MNMEKDNGRERGEEKQEKNGNRKESGNKEKNRRRESNEREWLVEERGIRVQESGVEMEQDEGWKEKRMGERGCGKE